MWRASGTITDPEIVSPVICSTGVSFDGPKFVPSPTRIDLFDGRYVLLFSDDQLVVFLSPEDVDAFHYYSLLYFLSYRSRVRYNITSIPYEIEFPKALPATEEINFSVDRLTLKEREETLFGKLHRIQSQELEPFTITVLKSDIERHLRKATKELHLAITYFLIGGENLQYFLIDFYKAIETIKLSFGLENDLLKALKPYGLSRTDYEVVKRYANDQREPLSIGRHAPQPGTDIRVIDTRQLLTEPLSKKVWTESVHATRRVIDAYSAYLFDQSLSGAKLVPNALNQAN